MIPLLNATGAAIVYLLATIVEYIIYLRSSVLIKISDSWRSLGICISIALLSGFTVEYISNFLFLKLLLGIIIYFVFLIITKQIKRTDLVLIKEWMVGEQLVELKQLPV